MAVGVGDQGGLAIRVIGGRGDVAQGVLDGRPVAVTVVRVAGGARGDGGACATGLGDGGLLPVAVVGVGDSGDLGSVAIRGRGGNQVPGGVVAELADDTVGVDGRTRQRRRRRRGRTGDAGAVEGNTVAVEQLVIGPRV